jgi:hypothetical protein
VLAFASPSAIAPQCAGNGSITVEASWDGATNVARLQARGGATPALFSTLPNATTGAKNDDPIARVHPLLVS